MCLKTTQKLKTKPCPSLLTFNPVEESIGKIWQIKWPFLWFTLKTQYSKSKLHVNKFLNCINFYKKNNFFILLAQNFLMTRLNCTHHVTERLLSMAFREFQKVFLPPAHILDFYFLRVIFAFLMYCMTKLWNKITILTTVTQTFSQACKNWCKHPCISVMVSWSSSYRYSTTYLNKF